MKRQILMLTLFVLWGLGGGNALMAAETLKFDAAENGTHFSFDETPADSDGLPAYGTEYITEGYLYPPGTLNGTNGVNADGSPEFPDKVIGTWTCRGWHVGNGFKTEKGPWAAATQLFNLSPTPGEKMIVTEGLLLPEVNVPIKRAITGGTGKYAGARGEGTETVLGFPNRVGGVNSRIELKVK
jgi:hypothetical protein